MYHSHQEIFTQGESLKQSLNYILSKKEEIKAFFQTTAYDEIVFVACGSSYWLSLSAVETFFEKLHIRCSAVTSGDIVMNPESYKHRYSKPLIIAPSRSGSTTETLTALKFLKSHYPCPVLSIVEYENAPLTNYSELSLHIPWANETSVCQTRSFSNLYLVCILMAGIVAEDQVLLADIWEYISTFEKLSQRTERFVKSLIGDHADVKGLITLGNGKLYGVMCEGAYITVEMAQAPAHFFYTLEFRHGPIVLLDETYLVVLFSAGNQTELEEKLITDIQAKGAKVLVISAEINSRNADYTLSLGKNTSVEVVGLYASFVTQAIAHYKALQLNVNPDSPKDLVPWISIQS